MTAPVRGPAVELTIRVRYPLPEYLPEYVEFGLHSTEEMVAEHVELLEHDPAELAELLSHETSVLSIEWEVDDAEDPWAGGSLDLTPAEVVP